MICRDRDGCVEIVVLTKSALLNTAVCDFV